MKPTNQQRDVYAFIRERAAQLWQEGEWENARRLLRELDEEQLRRLQAYRQKETAAAT